MFKGSTVLFVIRNNSPAYLQRTRAQQLTLNSKETNFFSQYFTVEKRKFYVGIDRTFFNSYGILVTNKCVKNLPKSTQATSIPTQHERCTTNKARSNSGHVTQSLPQANSIEFSKGTPSKQLAPFVYFCTSFSEICF